MTRRGKKVPACSDCGAGVVWLTLRGRRLPFDRLPVDADTPLAMPCYRGEAWLLDDLVLELLAEGADGFKVHERAREGIPWHLPHVCPVAVAAP